MSRAQWMRLPVELRERPQWLLAGPNEKGELKVPVSVDVSGRVCPGSHSDSATWLDFDYAMECAEELNYGIGYVLSADDPFTCVDLDVKDQHNAPGKPDLWTTPEQLQNYAKLIDWLGCYAELSQSGKGVHLWCRGKIGEGVKSRGVEVYSQLRFIACTGRSIHAQPLPVGERQAKLDDLVRTMRATQAARDKALYESEQELSDEELYRRASTADNADKFNRLWAGDWVAMGYPSQSEADLSLMSMLTFYSRSNEQCRRLFRRSKLGERDKAVKDDRYLDYTLRLIRGRQAREDAMLSQTEDAARSLVSGLTAQAMLAAQAVADLQGGTAPSLDAPAPAAAAPQPGGGLPWPPGLAGDIARFIYGSAPRPVKEVAIVAALGWLAGVCGKSWVIPGSGLNLYIILVARSAIGKEAMHSGLAALTSRLREGVPSAGNYVSFSDFASGPALAKACAEQSCFVNVSGEWGRKLKAIASDGSSGPMQSLRTVMTNLYQKSGPASIVGGINYSSKDNNVASITGVSYSLIGETTPETLYASLTDSMMEDGFLSRFNLVEYDGQRPPANRHINLIPDNELTTRCQNLVSAATQMMGNHQRMSVNRDSEAAVLMDAFDAECDHEINSTEKESVRQMWNRAHLKMCRVAALLAVGDDPNQPVIRQHHVMWALDLVRRDITLMTRRMASGDVGAGDNARFRKLMHVVREFLTRPLPEGYGVPQQMKHDAVVPRKYLQMRTASLAAFSQHPLGEKRALDDAIASACDSGYMVEIPKDKAGELYTFQGRCFRVVQLPS